MTDKNVSEKLAYTITNLIKKTNTFEKVDNALTGISVFMFITGALSLLNAYSLYKWNNALHKREESVSLDIFETIMEVKKMNKKIDKIIEQNEKLNLFIENHNSMQIQQTIDSESELSSVTGDFNESESELENVNDELIEYELLYECYDNIPCNNSKKVTGMNRLFEWK